MILFEWQIHQPPSGEQESILRVNGILMSEARTLVLGSFPGSVLLVPTLHEAVRCLRGMRVPAGPLLFELVGDSSPVGITVDALCNVRLSYRGTVMSCEGRELVNELCRASLDVLRTMDENDSEVRDLIGFFMQRDGICREASTKTRKRTLRQ